MLIHWRASAQWLVPMSSPSSGREASSITGERRLPGTSLEACGSRALIEALSRSFLPRCTSRNVAPGLGRCQQHSVFRCITNLAHSNPAEVALAIELQQLFAEGLARYALRSSKPLAAALLFTDVRATPGSLPRQTPANRK